MARTTTMLPLFSAFAILFLLFVTLLFLFGFIFVVFFLVWEKKRDNYFHGIIFLQID